MTYKSEPHKKELVVLLQKKFSMTDAEKIVGAIESWIEEERKDLEDKINKRGEHDPDW